MLKELNGIIIKSINYSDNDKILTVFTKEEGKVSIIAKGARRKKSKISAQTDIFTYTYFCCYPGKTLYTMKNCEYIKSFNGLQYDLERILFANYVCELMNIFYEDKMEEIISFNLLYFTLGLIEKEDVNNLSIITLAFMLKLLGITGLIPDFSGCMICGKKDIDEGYLDFEEGGIICSKCSHSHFSKRKISKNLIDIINKFLYINLKDIKGLSPKFKLEDYNEVILILNNYIEYSLNRKTNSFKFLSDMLEF